MAVTQTPLGTSVHQHDDNPIYGETATHVLLDDDAAGAYFVLRQTGEHAKAGEVRLTMDELKAVYQAAQDLLENYPCEVAG